MSPWKVILATMVIFCCGVVTGALVIRTGLRPPPVRYVSLSDARGLNGSNMLHSLDRNLNLTTNQHEQVERVIRESQARIKLLLDEIEPRLQKEMARVHQDIRDELSPVQSKKYDEMNQNRDLTPSRPRRGEGPPPREGDSFRGRTNRFRGTNGPQTNAPPPAPPPVQSATPSGVTPPVAPPSTNSP